MRIGHALLLSLILVACAPRPETGTTIGTSAVAGTVTDADGQPAVHAFVYAYLSSRGSTRGPADFGIRVEADGRYLLEIPPGDYLLIARKGLKGNTPGPPRQPESWALLPENPVTIEPGQVISADFTLQSGSPAPRMKAGSLLEGETGFTGHLVDADGKAVPGAFVLAYRDRDFHRMPDFTSMPADRSGHFHLYVPEPGTYCLAARTRTRGQPIHGELYGLLDGSLGACRSVHTGTLLDIGTIELTPYSR